MCMKFKLLYIYLSILLFVAEFACVILLIIVLLLMLINLFYFNVNN